MYGIRVNPEKDFPYQIIAALNTIFNIAIEYKAYIPEIPENATPWNMLTEYQLELAQVILASISFFVLPLIWYVLKMEKEKFQTKILGMVSEYHLQLMSLIRDNGTTLHDLTISLQHEKEIKDLQKKAYLQRLKNIEEFLEKNHTFVARKENDKN